MSENVRRETQGGLSEVHHDMSESPRRASDVRARLVAAAVRCCFNLGTPPKQPHLPLSLSLPPPYRSSPGRSRGTKSPVPREPSPASARRQAAAAPPAASSSQRRQRDEATSKKASLFLSEEAGRWPLSSPRSDSVTRKSLNERGGDTCMWHSRKLERIAPSNAITRREYSALRVCMWVVGCSNAMCNTN